MPDNNQRKSGGSRGSGGGERGGRSGGKGRDRQAGKYPRSGGSDRRSSSGGRSSRDAGRQSSRGEPGKQRRDLKGAAVDLPRWVIEDLSRVTPKERVSAALEELGTATNAMIEGRYKVALRAARKAKDLAPRDATVRETLGLAAYRSGDWQTALAELRAYRRLAGEPTHMPVEMDVLRALGRGEDVKKTWEELKKAGATPIVHKEGLVVYASHLIDSGEVGEARKLTTPKQIKKDPYPADLRVWYVASRANALAGDPGAARQLRDAIVLADPAFPGLEELDSAIASAG